MRCLLLSLALLLSSFSPLFSQTVRITTWNLEHLGSYGRGLGGIGAGSLGFRSDEQLQQIAAFIKDTLKTDVVAIQEVALSEVAFGIKINNELKKLVGFLGEEWSYAIGSRGNEMIIGNQEDNMQNAFLWNAGKVRLIKAFDLELPNIYIGERAFDRLPFAGYFEAIHDNHPNRTDFLLVNVHLKSGQDNDENHLAAMIIIEQNLNLFLKKNEVKESDIAILGDFNDNPYDPRYSDLLYKYMGEEDFVDLTTEELGATRMDANLTSIIDHVLVNKSFQREMADVKAWKYMPSRDVDELAKWRRTYSDHFPLTFEVKVKTDNDVD